MSYQSHGVTSLSEYMDDFVIYRKLAPADPRLPSLDQLRQKLNLPADLLPRKAEPVYGFVVAEMLRQGRALDLPNTPIQQVLYIGDTQHNDGNAFRNICTAGNWPGWAFIGKDQPDQAPRIQISGSLYVSNRWSALPDFVKFVKDKGLTLNENTAVVIDMDKTAIGARGRNDKVIDAARVEGVKRTVADLLGSHFDQVAFEAAYDELNRPNYHAFTADNQDYLAYICLMLGAGLFKLDELTLDVHSRALGDFGDFISRVQARRSELAETGLTPVHDDVWACVQAGDPTPFKSFRYNEYLTTTARFGDTPETPAGQLLTEQICITQEVRATTLALKARGALIFGVSDKPDEASLPNAQQAAAGMQPLHRLESTAVGASRTG